MKANLNTKQNETKSEINNRKKLSRLKKIIINEKQSFDNQGDPTMNRGGLRNFRCLRDRRGNNRDRDDWRLEKMRNKQGMIRYEYVFFITKLILL